MSPFKIYEWIITKKGIKLSEFIVDESLRLDVFVSKMLQISRSKASNLVKKGETESKQIIVSIKETLEPLKVDYVAVVDRNFNEIEKIDRHGLTKHAPSKASKSVL